MTTRHDNRARFPELAGLVDSLRGAGFEPRVTSIRDHNGSLVAGKPDEPDPRTFEIDASTPARLAEQYRVFRVHEQRPGREFGYRK
ncbi:MAG TPA: hypothetical protein VGE09_11370 [Pseudoxanthomonas sp.]